MQVSWETGLVLAPGCAKMLTGAMVLCEGSAEGASAFMLIPTTVARFQFLTGVLAEDQRVLPLILSHLGLSIGTAWQLASLRRMNVNMADIGWICSLSVNRLLDSFICGSAGASAPG